MGRSGSSAGAEADGEDADATSVAVVAGRFSTGRSESASPAGASDEAVDAPGALAGAGRFRTGRSESPSGSGTGGGVDGAGADAGAGEDAGAAGPADGASSGDLAFGLARPSTGRPSGASGAGFDMTALFLAAASFAAAIALADCQVPAPRQVLLPCRAPVTVNSPRETPVRKPSYIVPLSSAIGTGDALYALAS